MDELENRMDKDLGFILKYENVAWYDNGIVTILDRRVYPMKISYVKCYKYQDVAIAIRNMVTQSAGPFVAVLMGMALAANNLSNLSNINPKEYLKNAAITLGSARPTTSHKLMKLTMSAYDLAANLIDNGASLSVIELSLKNNAIAYLNNNYRKYDKIGRLLASKIEDGYGILTHCYGETVIGGLLRALKNKNIKIYCAETRPYFQGARLTASLTSDMGFDTTVITDNMIAFLMDSNRINVFTSASDVITMDGHVVNKVGTYQIAILSEYFKIPYYVTGTPSAIYKSVDDVKIEYRDPMEVMKYLDIKITADNVNAIYPAFDIVKPELVSGIITDKGIFLSNRIKEYFV